MNIKDKMQKNFNSNKSQKSHILSWEKKYQHSIHDFLKPKLLDDKVPHEKTKPLNKNNLTRISPEGSSDNFHVSVDINPSNLAGKENVAISQNFCKSNDPISFSYLFKEISPSDTHPEFFTAYPSRVAQNPDRLRKHSMLQDNNINAIMFCTKSGDEVFNYSNNIHNLSLRNILRLHN